MRQLVVGSVGSGKTTYAKSIANKAISEGVQVIAVSQSMLFTEWKNAVHSVKTLIEDWERLQALAKNLNSPMKLPPTLVVIDPIPEHTDEEEAVITLLRNSRKMGIDIIVLDFSTDVMSGHYDLFGEVLFDEIVVTAHGHRNSQAWFSQTSGLDGDKVRRALSEARSDVLVIPSNHFSEYIL